MTLVAEQAAAPNTALISVNCWCESSTVMVPVQWVSEARTGSCGPDCGPGCPTKDIDSFDWDEDGEQPTNTTTNRRTTRMKRFDPDKYNPREDSTYGYSGTTARREHPDALILQVVDGDLPVCPCGCTDAPSGSKAKFAMGHDARLKGKLARATAAHRKVVLTDTNRHVVEVVDPLDYASRFSTDKMDWQASTLAAANRARGKASASAERKVLARAMGPQVGDTKVIKVGRWDKTGKIVAIYEDKGEILYEYVDANNNVRQARQDADGKVREVK